MSRWVLALVAFGFTLAPVRADPKPLWEIEAFPDAKGYHPVRWLGYTPDGKTLAAQVVEKDNFAAPTCRLFVWDVATRKEGLNHKLGECVRGGAGMSANATTKVGTVLVAGSAPGEVRMADGANVSAKDMRRWPLGVWLNADSSDGLWLMDEDLGAYSLSHGKMPPLVPDPKKVPTPEQWLKVKLPGDWGDNPPVGAANSDLTRFAVSSRTGRQLTLSNLAIDGRLKLTEVATVPDGHDAGISTLQFSPDGKTLATGGWDTNVCLWDVTKAGKDWKPRATVSAGNWTVVSLAFSPDGRTLAVGTTGGKKWPNLYLIDVTAGKALASYRLESAVTAVAYSPDGKVLITGDSLGRIKAWDAEALRNP